MAPQWIEDGDGSGRFVTPLEDSDLIQQYMAAALGGHLETLQSIMARFGGPPIKPFVPPLPPVQQYTPLPPTTTTGPYKPMPFDASALLRTLMPPTATGP